MARAWVIDNKGIAVKVRNASRSCAHQIIDCGANRECPNCHYRIDNSDVSDEWPGLPVGVKFDPSDLELLDHLAAKCGVGSSKPHMFIDEFISTLQEDQGICYTHPENLPGAKKDGSSVHFFHKTINAYTSGQRKRRKVHHEQSSCEEQVRWHKTGKTKSVMENGVHKGFKKIMVLYKSSKKGFKPDKSNWVMHQFHLGAAEDEREGEYVASKVFYQQKSQSDKNTDDPVGENSDALALQTSPKTPITKPPVPPRPGKSVTFDDSADDYREQPLAPEQHIKEENSWVPVSHTEDETGFPSWLAGESQNVESCDFNDIDDTLLCKEVFDSSSIFCNSSGGNNVSYSGIQTTGKNRPAGIADLENLELDSPPDFQLSDLQFSSQDSVFSWIDRL
ncbi:hypothetical protein K2173_013917 [Erythroxylum novogranatense]|uniref:NAC domain-containing protein n=1 Tax=Erythroxylum novogranatense TaxID=1862640 RepID=A0AAV8SCX5_9ROSI|nr:hypothetical protein K2173_013917 [Erythroxylum novogranatense]